MKPGESRYTPAQRAALVHDWLAQKAAGVLQQDWCRAHGIPAPTLNRWVKKREKEAEAASSPVASSPPTPPAADNAGLALVEGAITSLPELPPEPSPTAPLPPLPEESEGSGGSLVVVAGLLILLVVGGVLSRGRVGGRVS